MGWRGFSARLRMLWSRRRLIRDLDEETAFHLEQMQTELRGRGVAPGETAYAARKLFGNALRIRERSLEVWKWRWLEGLAQDLRFGIRMLLRKPLFSLVVTAVLALGIGLNAAMFAIVQAVILRPLPYRDPAQLTVIWQSSPEHKATGEWFNTYRDFEEWQKRSKSFAQLAALTWATDGYTVRRSGRLQNALVIPVSANFFSMLGVEAQYGRVFEARDRDSGCAVIASYAYWRDHLGADGHLADIGLTLDDRPCQVVGIMPERFSFYPRATQMWMVMTQDSEFVQKPWEHATGVFGRLRPGVSRAAAEQELTAIQMSIAGERPKQEVMPPSAPVVLEMQQEFTWLSGRNLRNGLWLLSGAVALVLLIACVNVASLLLGRAAERQREMAIRVSIGCGRARMMRQMLTESLVLSICGAGMGLGLAALVLRVFCVVNPVELPPGNVVEMRWPVLLFTVALSVVCTLLCGIAPAWQASRTELSAALKSDARVGGGVPQRAGSLLVVLQVALSLVLLSGAILLAASLVRLASTPLGFRTDHLLTAEVNMAFKPGAKATKGRLAEEILARVSGLPGVLGAAFVSNIEPLGSEVLALAGKTFDARSASHDVASQTVSTDYFQTTEVPLLAGHGFTGADRKDTAPVAIINQRLERQYFPDGDALGRQIRLGSPDDKAAQWLTVVGIAGNVKTTSVFQEMGYHSPPVVYRPMSQAPETVHTLLLRTAAEPLTLSEKVQQAVAGVDRDVVVSNIETMRSILREQSAQPRFRTVLLGGFAGMALLLAALGIYGLLAQQVIHRTREIGIRMALGANRTQILGRVVRQALGLTVVGIGLGVAGSLAAGRILAGLLYETSASDPSLLSAGAMVFLGVAVAASFLPAWRASHVEPTVAMRAE